MWYTTRRARTFVGPMAISSQASADHVSRRAVMPKAADPTASESDATHAIQCATCLNRRP